MNSLSYKYSKEEKKKALHILKAIDNICWKNNLVYSLAYGTLLGAVRHRGIIPWDDDLDIWMKKDAIQKLSEIIKKEGALYDLGIFVPEENGLDWKETKIYIVSEQKNNRKTFSCDFPYSFPFLDVYAFSSNDENVLVEVRDNKFFEIKLKNAFPVRRVKFETIKMNIFRKPLDFLDYHYPNWEKIIITNDWDHRDKKSLEDNIEKIKISRELKSNFKFYNRFNWIERR